MVRLATSIAGVANTVASARYAPLVRRRTATVVELTELVPGLGLAVPLEIVIERSGT